jgi:hypothetical protein
VIGQAKFGPRCRLSGEVGLNVMKHAQSPSALGNISPEASASDCTTVLVLDIARLEWA